MQCNISEVCVAFIKFVSHHLTRFAQKVGENLYIFKVELVCIFGIDTACYSDCEKERERAQ
jgi:hypothetical protein